MLSMTMGKKYQKLFDYFVKIYIVSSNKFPSYTLVDCAANKLILVFNSLHSNIYPITYTLKGIQTEMKIRLRRTVTLELQQ